MSSTFTEEIKMTKGAKHFQPAKTFTKEEIESITTAEQLFSALESKEKVTWGKFLKKFELEKLKKILLQNNEKPFDAMQRKYTNNLERNIAIFCCYLSLYYQIRKTQPDYTTKITIPFLGYTLKTFGSSKTEKGDGKGALHNFLITASDLTTFNTELNKPGSELNNSKYALTHGTELPQFAKQIAELPAITAKHQNKL